MRVEVVDLFCGVGGLTHGLINAGLKVIAGFDFDETCKYAYEENNKVPFILKNIKKISAEEVNKFFSKNVFKVLAGCAPCQPFSQMRKKLGDEHNKSDEKYGLLYHFSRLVEKIKPDIVSMENVSEMQRSEIFQDFLNMLKSSGYYVDHRVIHCYGYGIAQSRRRFVLLASKHGNIRIKEPTHAKRDVSIRQFIYGLPIIAHGKTNAQDPLHTTAKLSRLNVKRIQASKPAGSWKDWPTELLLKCHKKSSGQTYTSVYGRMSWDKIGPTITTQFYSYGTGRYGHPDQNRALTLREGALLQTFPMGYKFVKPNEKFSIKDVARHIGNAVPVKLGKAIGESIRAHIETIMRNNERI